MTNKTTATTLLQEGQDILKARAALRDSDEGERSMARAVAIFNAWTGSSMSEENGWRFMIALKQAREIQGDFHKDDYQDLVNYSALLGECASDSGNVPDWVPKEMLEAEPAPEFKSYQGLGETVDKSHRRPIYNTEIAEFFGVKAKPAQERNWHTDIELAAFKAEAYRND